MRIPTIIAALLLFGSACLAAEDREDSHPFMSDTFFIDVGMYFPAREIALSVNGPIRGAQQQDIDFESEFGLKKSDETFALNLGWRFGEKWQLGAQFFESDGPRSRTLDEDVEWGEYVFGAGTGVRAGMDFSMIRTFFARRFESAAEHHEFGIGAGLHWLEIGAFIEGNAILNGVQAGFRRESVSAAAPLPNIGGWYTRSLSKNWVFKARFDWLSADVGDYDGRLINASAGFNYRLSQNFGLGVSYNLFELDVGVDKKGWRGDVELSYQGVFVHASAFW